MAVAHLAEISGHDLVMAKNLVEATSDVGSSSRSQVLKRIAVLSKSQRSAAIGSDRGRLGGSDCPLQPSSSVMPGKVNPVIPEMVNQVAYQVIGNDLTVTLPPRPASFSQRDGTGNVAQCAASLHPYKGGRGTANGASKE